MKLKHRSNLFLVVRESYDTEIPIAGFLTPESADEYAGVCQQDFEERNIDGFTFKVVPLIYYDM
jgi:hypothetical protein